MERPGTVNDYKYAIMRAMPLQNTRSHQRESVQSAELTPMITTGDQFGIRNGVEVPL